MNEPQFKPRFECPRGHRHWEGSAFCTVCGAGPVAPLHIAERDRRRLDEHDRRREGTWDE